MDLNDFLPGLKRIERHAPLAKGRHAGQPVLFMLAKEGQGNSGGTGNAGVRLSVVDRHLKPIEADYRYYDNDEALVLRSMERIRDKKSFDVEWGDTDNGTASPGMSVSLADNPQLLFQLIRCNNLVAEDGKPVNVADETSQLVLTLTETENGKHGAHLVMPSLSVAGSDNDESLEKKPKDGTDGELALLSDSFVMCGHTIWPIASIGDNFAQMESFLSPVDAGMVGLYLSVLFSFVDNVTVAYSGHDIEMSDTDAMPRPAIVFEKVDADRTLYLRLVEQVKGIDIDFMQRFDLSVVATEGADGRFVVRRLVRLDIEGLAETLSKQIASYAPNREAARQVYNDGTLFIIPEQTAGPFLLQGLPALLHDYLLIGADKLRDYKVQPVLPKLKVSLSSGIDFLEGDATLQLGDEQFTLQQILAQYNKNKYIELSSGDRAIIEDGYMRRLERIFSKKKGKNGGIQVSFFDLPEIEDLINEPLEGEAFRHHREVYEGFNALHSQTLKTPKLNAKLRPYQKEGIKWIKYLYDNNLGGCLADDMGLGKTVQTIGVLTMVYPKVKRPTLIVMPRSLLFNWQSELRKFAPQLSVYTYYAGTRDIDEAMKHQVVLTTYAIVRNDIDEFRKQHFLYAILDESQNIKNLTAQVTQAAFLLKADHRLALSGTPIENNLTELYSLFRFLNPTMFGSADDFNTRYAAPIQKDDDKEAMASLRRKIFPFMLRRLKKDVLKDLPDRIEQTLYVEMNSRQAEFYERRRQFYYQQVKQTIAAEGVQKSQFVMFQALSELRRIASVPESLSDGMITSPKLEQLSDSVMEAVENGHKVVVFFNFIAGLELMGDRLEAEGVDYCSMTGSTRDRRSIVERFQHDPGCRVMLMTLKTGGVGLNLTAADTVFIVEPWWNKAAEEQAINRLHRFGQKSKVLSYSLITQGTIEEKIQLLQQQKAELFEGLIGADSSSSKHLSEDDINFILG